MTTQSHVAIDTDHEDELVVIKVLSEMIQEEQWDLTALGRERLQADKRNCRQHRPVIDGR